MTNDTNTLMGALKEAGETLAANLTTQGVPSTWDEGLTTLIGKVLDITPTPPTPTPASVDLTGTKSILSYADSEQCVLTATVLDSSDNPVEGVDVNLYNGSTLWDTLTTDSSGECSKTYSSAGAGDITFTAEVDGTLLTKSYAIEDCLKVYSDTWTQGGSNKQIALNFALPSSFKINWKSKTTNYAQLIVGKTYGTLDYILNHNSSSNKSTFQLLKRVNSSSVQTVITSGNDYPSSQTYDMEYTYNNGQHTLLVNDVQVWSVTDTSVEITHLLYWSIRDATTSNLKVKPL